MGVKVGLRPRPKWTPPILGSGSSNVLEFFNLKGKFKREIACRDIFWGQTPLKKGREFVFEGILDFDDFQKNLSKKRLDWQNERTTEWGNKWYDITSALFKNLFKYTSFFQLDIVFVINITWKHFK
jgi:hypothetical protein